VGPGVGCAILASWYRTQAAALPSPRVAAMHHFLRSLGCAALYASTSASPEVALETAGPSRWRYLAADQVMEWTGQAQNVSICST